MPDTNIIASNSTWGTYTIAAPMDRLSTGEIHNQGKPAAPPKGLISTTGVQTKAGWIGQVVVHGVIVHETQPIFSDDPDQDRDDAMEAVNRYVLDRIRDLFADRSGEATA